MLTLVLTHVIIYLFLVTNCNVSVIQELYVALPVKARMPGFLGYVEKPWPFDLATYENFGSNLATTAIIDVRSGICLEMSNPGNELK